MSEEQDTSFEHENDLLSPSETKKRKKNRKNKKQEYTTSLESSSPAKRQMLPHKNIKSLLPPEQQRAGKLFYRNKKAYIELVKAELTRLQELYNLQPAGKKDKRQALIDWGREHVHNNYPGLGQTVAYAFPAVYLGKHDIHDKTQTGLFTEKQESSVRGDMATGKVELAFRLLSNSHERNGQRPLVVISNLLHENVLIWLEKAREKLVKSDREFIDKHCPDMTADPTNPSTRYYDIPCLKEAGMRAARGESDLIILDQSVGIVFVEVKSFGQQSDLKKTSKKMDQASSQMDRVEDIFKEVFKQDTDVLKVQRHKVIALPNLSKEFVRDIPKENHLSNVIWLTEDDLDIQPMETAERDYDLTNIKNWWNTNLEAQSSSLTQLSSELMQDVIARYLGTLSRPCDFDDAQARDHVRSMNDAIRCTGKVFKSKTFTQSDFMSRKTEMDAILTDAGQQYKRVHLKGATRSGKTTITILKAQNFLRSADTHVIVIDIYRGIAGRPGGCHVFKSIVKENKAFEKRVHHVELDSNLELSQHFERALENNGVIGVQPNNLMFIIDQILPINIWKSILDKLDSDYKSSCIWCSDGILQQSLGDKYGTEFISLHLRRMARVPPSVRKVLYHVDWLTKTDKNKRYCLESPNQNNAESHQENCATECMPSNSQEQKSTKDIEFDTNVCISMHGPFVLSIRHQNHKSEQDPSMLDCEDCALDLAELLQIKLNLFANRSKALEAAVEEKMLDCSIVILFSIPIDSYETSHDLGEQNVEISSVECENYSRKVANSKFVKKLEQLLPVGIMKLTAAEKEEIQDFESEQLWDKVLLCWVDKFQGVDRDVVIYLPSEKANVVPQVSAGERKLPVPGVTVSQTHSLEASVEATSATPATETGNATQQMPFSESARDASKRKMAHLFWSNDDIERYSDWDKTNLMFAGTRAEGQLILMVP